MEFELWEALDLEGDISEQKEKLTHWLGDFFEIKNVQVCNEGIFKAKLIIKSLDELLVIPNIIDDNIVVYGVESDLIMSVTTMQELGLD